jgi:hypothetical protein
MLGSFIFRELSDCFIISKGIPFIVSFLGMDESIGAEILLLFGN